MTETARTTPIVGSKAPGFELQGYFKGEMKGFRLADYKGKWVYLLFYPLDFTFVCPTEVLSFSKAAPEFNVKNTQVLGVSVDSQFVHKAWVETKKEEGGLGGSLNFPLLADIKKEVARDYGVLADAGVALRGLFLIDPDGTIMHATVNNLPVGRSASEAIRTLKAFQFVAANKGKVCPADWDESKEAMAASPEGMRKYLSSH
ncbi:MAG: redoxin domain-containing protein [Acidobacteria bacterium]|nr:redoxin domain-containing protein [Acidobacteriota bacterium]